jgi:hypothetical protein
MNNAMKKYSKHSLLNIAMWNIEGLTLNKTIDNHFLQLISNYHILSLVETWIDKDGPSVNLPGFEMI